MRILINGTNYYPEKIGIGKYTGEMAEWLAAHGHEVRVVTAPPYYPEWRVADGYSKGWNRDKAQGSRGKVQVNAKGTEQKGQWVKHGQDAGKANPPQPPFKKKGGSLVVWRCPLWVPKKLSGLKRILHLASFALSSLPIMLWQIFWKPDVVLVIEPPLMCAPAAWIVARLSGARAWLHIQDFEVDAAFELGILRADWLKQWALMAERLLMRRFDRVSTISPAMIGSLINKSVPQCDTFMLPNWVDTDEIFPLERQSVFRAELKIDYDVCVALYSGNMGEKQGLEVVLEAARLQMQGTRGKGEGARRKRQGENQGLRADESDTEQVKAGAAELDPLAFSPAPEVIFVLCGDGAAKARLKEAFGELPNVLWLPLQPAKRLNELLNLADIHLLPQRADAADLVMPSKLTGMMASGRPILATAHPGTQIAQVVENRGMVVPPGDAEVLWDSLKKLAVSPNERKRFGSAARMYAEECLGLDATMCRFENELFRLTGGVK